MLYQSIDSFEIIKQLKKDSLFLQVKGTEYSHSFFSYFLDLASLEGIVVKHLLAGELSDYCTRQTSIFEINRPTLLFLGLIESVEQYKGIKKIAPFRENQSICFFYNKPSLNQDVTELHLNCLSTTVELQKLWLSFNAIVPLSNKFLYHLSALLMDHYKPLSVEQGCSLLKYAPLMQHFSEQEILEVFQLLLESKHSLFELSTLFFSRNKTLFFIKWLELQDVYPLLFWISYWSDQLFRAYYYIKAKEVFSNVPKHLTARLPFSFVNNDYASVNPSAILALHSLLGVYDHRIKKGYAVNMNLILHTWFLD